MPKLLEEMVINSSEDADHSVKMQKTLIQILVFAFQLEDAGSSNLDNLLSRYITGSHLPPQPTSTMNPSPGPSALSPGSSGKGNGYFYQFLPQRK